MVKRWEPWCTVTETYTEARPEDNGRFVDYSDYATLAAENERLKAENAELGVHLATAKYAIKLTRAEASAAVKVKRNSDGETLAEEFGRLVREYHEPDTAGTQTEAWNLIAYFAVENADAILQALTTQPAAPIDQPLRDAAKAMAAEIAGNPGLVGARAIASEQLASVADVSMPGGLQVVLSLAAPQEANTLTQVGWAYQDKRWDADRWHVCGWEKPREHEGRQVKPVYITEAAPQEAEAVARDWVACPICDEPDMRKETDANGNSLIYCVNHGCPSNGRTVPSPPAQAVTEAQVEAAARAYAERQHGKGCPVWEEDLANMRIALAAAQEASHDAA